ncbi:LOW QUALITY PROTEIN: podocalyxin-like protein 2 [Rhinatrema bivittatum]|uniref:LOW QUALITY PROTEIN: podocalyxin-like protein 2 n=1 Tax=Rhinatrema bivittatum TaxID=194408 RepID=UPI00112CB770|nr:LOW QUALITY PROTEIN: podocalyxin-like protein 2 [Rhinatrema bivittatum]
MNPRLNLLLAFGSLCLYPVATEESTAEGLTSASLVEFPVSHLEVLESAEQPNAGTRESEAIPSLLQAFQGSGFSSQENEEALILQSPPYLWEDGEVNETSLDLGPATDYTSPVSLPVGNETHSKVDAWETATPQLFTDTAEPALNTSSSHALVEEEALILLGQDGRAHTRKTHLLKNLSAEPRGKEESLISVLLSTATSKLGSETQPARKKGNLKEGSVSKNTSDHDPGTSVEPSLLPLSAVPLATTVGSGKILEKVREDFSKANLRMEQLEVVLTETAKDDDLLVMEYDSLAPVGPRGSASESSSVVPWVRVNEVLQTPSNISQKVMTTLSPRGKHSKNRSTFEAAEPTEEAWDSAQVICKDWSNLAGKNYVILNMSEDMDCDLFRLQKGQQLLSMVDGAFSRKAEHLRGTWMISLSKPNENDKHLLMTLAGEQGVVPIKDVLTALADIKKNLAELGIQNYSTTTSCQSRPSPSRSDYGKLFVVLVIIGSICAMIIVSGLLYICWQRRMPKLKNMSHGEELHFVENSCHDNPTLDVTMDSQSEMQEKKPSLNGGTVAAADGWNVFLNKAGKDEVAMQEEDTHL